MQLEKLKGCDKVFKEKRSGVDAGRPELEAVSELPQRRRIHCVVTKDATAWRAQPRDLYRIVAELTEKGVEFKVVDDPTMTPHPHRQAGHGHPRANHRVQNDIRRERQMDGMAKAKEREIRFRRKPKLTLRGLPRSGRCARPAPPCRR